MFRYIHTGSKKSVQMLCALAILFCLIAGTAAVPQKAQAGWPVTDVGNAGTHGANAGSQASNTALTVKDYVITVLKQVLMSIAKVLLNKLTEATVNWINGGFKGSPQFVSNPTSFFKGLGDTQLKNLVDVIGYDASKFPYGGPVAKALINNYVYSNSSFADKAKFTLDQTIGADWQRFQSDFRVGGWAGYDSYIQNPANNPFGMLYLASGEANKTVATAQAAAQTELAKGQGFLDQKTCVSYRDTPITPALPPAAPPQVYGPQQQTPGIQQAQQSEHQFLLGGAHTDADCLEWKTLSPGSVVQSQIATALGSKFSQNELAGALGNSVSAIINALTTTLLNKGLSALTTLTTNSSSSSGQVWSYDGLTLSGTGIVPDSNSPDSWANTPDEKVDYNALFFTGESMGLTDDNGDPVSLTIIGDAQRQVDAYKSLIGIFTGGTQNNPNGSITHIESFAEHIKELDDAVPGPKLGWQARLSSLIQTSQQTWAQRAQSYTIKSRKENAQDISDYLGDMATTISQQMTLQSLTDNVPSYAESQALIKNSISFSFQRNQYIDTYTSSVGTLQRLKSIRTSICGILLHNTTQPVVDSNCNVIVTTTSAPSDPGLTQFLGQHPDVQPAGPNPFDYLTDSGKQAMKSVTKAFALIEQDLPNAQTISQAENTYQQVKSEYDNITQMIYQVDSEKQILARTEAFRAQIVTHQTATYIGTDPTLPYLIPKIDPATLTQSMKNALTTMGSIAIAPNTYYFTPFFVPVAINAAGHAVPSSNPTGQVGNLTDGDSTGLSLVQLNTTQTHAQMLAALANDGSASLDADHADTFASLSDDNLVLVYSIMTSATPLTNLSPTWDSTLTGQALLVQTLDLVSDYDAQASKPVAQTSETLFYCQPILDQNDKLEYKYANLYSSLFHRPKVNLKCANFYDSSPADYVGDGY